MTPKQEKVAEEIIGRQVGMSGSTLEALRRAGLTEQTEVQLDFFFHAPNEKAARALASRLEENDCLDVKMQKVGGLLTRKYTVQGKTHATKVNATVLGEWLPWIVVQGAVLDCEFDGWGAEV